MDDAKIWGGLKLAADAARLNDRFYLFRTWRLCSSALWEVWRWCWSVWFLSAEPGRCPLRMRTTTEAWISPTADVHLYINSAQFTLYSSMFFTYRMSVWDHLDFVFFTNKTWLKTNWRTNMAVFGWGHWLKQSKTELLFILPRYRSMLLINQFDL